MNVIMSKNMPVHEFVEEVDSLVPYKELHATPVLKCTGRGRKPKGVPSIFELNLPDIVVKVSTLKLRAPSDSDLTE